MQQKRVELDNYSSFSQFSASTVYISFPFLSVSTKVEGVMVNRVQMSVTYAVAICPAAGHGLKKTKCPAVRKFHRIFTENFFQAS